MIVKRLLRIARDDTFYLLDMFGNYIFFLLRLLRIIPQYEEFIPEKIRRILIIRLDRIGDVILSTPAFRAVRKRFPDTTITLLIRPYTKGLVVNNESIDKILIFREYLLLKTLKEVWNLDVDLTIVLNYSFFGNFLACFSGAPHRIGFDSPGGRFFLTKKVPNDMKLIDYHKVDLYLNMVRSIGADSEDKETMVSITEEGEAIAGNFFKKNCIDSDRLIVAVHPGARQAYIRWRKEGFAAVADKIIENNNAQVILIGSDKERRLIDEVVLCMKNRTILAVGLSLSGIISLLKRCHLFIGNSTGPMHIAAALKVPVVAIFGSKHPLDSYKKWGPWGEGHIVVSKNLNCKNCHPGDCRTFDCMKLITVEDVLEAVSKQMTKVRK